MTVAPEIQERLDAAPEGTRKLAQVLSLAATIEPGLVRRARLLRPELDASAEADLWFSPLVEAHTPRGISLDPEVAEALRAELAEDPDLLARAWRLTQSFHRDAPWSIRMEEKVRYLSLAPEREDDSDIDKLLVAAGREMTKTEEGPSALDLARWMVRALPRLPSTVRNRGVSRALDVGAAARLSTWIELPETEVSEQKPNETMEPWLPWAVPEGLPEIAVAVRLLEAAVELGPIDSDDTAFLHVPMTQPLAVEVSWQEAGATIRHWVRFESGETRRVEVAADSIELTTLNGQRYRLSQMDDRTEAVSEREEGELDFGALRAHHRPFLAREAEMKELVEWFESSQGHLWITGTPGVGKTALLCAFLDLIDEGYGPSLYHFVDPSVPGSDQIETIETSLLSQLLRQEPELRKELERKSPEEIDVEDIETALDEIATDTFIVLVDSGEEETGLGEDLDVFLSSTLRSFRQVLIRRTEPTVEVHRLDLDRRTDSNHELCGRYAELHQEELTSLASTPEEEGRGEEALAHPVDALLDRADGNIGRLKAMHAWLARQEIQPTQVERIPPTLYGAGETSWRELESELGPEATRIVLGLLCAAKKPLPRQTFYGPPTQLASNTADEVLIRLADTGWILAPGVAHSYWTGILRNPKISSAGPFANLRFHVASSDSSVCQFVGDLGPKERTRFHGLLADLFPWRSEPEGDDFERRYARLYQLDHLADAERWEEVATRVADFDYLTDVCREEGPEILSAQLSGVAAWLPDEQERGELQRRLERMAEIVGGHRGRLRADPDALPSLLSSELLRQFGETTTGFELGAEMAGLLPPFTSRSGRPWLQLRALLHPELPRAAEVKPRCAADSHLQTLLVSGTEKGMTLWDVFSEEIRQTLTGHPQPVSRVAMNLGSDFFVSIDPSGSLNQWSVLGDRTTARRLSEPPVKALAVDPPGLQILTGHDDGSIRTWRRDRKGKMQPDVELTGHRGPVHALSADERESLLASAGDGGLFLWSLPSKSRIRTFQGHTGPVRACELTRHGGRLLSGGADGTVRLWATDTGQQAVVCHGHQGPVLACRFLGPHDTSQPHPRLAVSASEDATVKLWNLATGECLETLFGSTPFCDLAVHKDGSALIAVDEQAVAWIVDRTGPSTQVAM